MAFFQFPAFADKLVNCGHKIIVLVGLIHTMDYRGHTHQQGVVEVLVLLIAPSWRRLLRCSPRRRLKMHANSQDESERTEEYPRCNFSVKSFTAEY